jgi:hypothetical protein
MTFPAVYCLLLLTVSLYLCDRYFAVVLFGSAPPPITPTQRLLLPLALSISSYPVAGPVCFFLTCGCGGRRGRDGANSIQIILYL